MIRIASLFIAFLLVIGAPAHAQEKGRNVFLGSGEITLPYIPGFKEVYGTNEAFDSHVRQFVPAENRLLGVYLAEADAVAIATDPGAPLARYMLVQTTKAGMLLKDPRDFQEIRDEIIRGTGAAFEKNQAVQQQLDNVSGYIEDQYHKRTKLKVGETKTLGAFMNYDGAFGIALLANVGVQTDQGTEDVPIATGVTVLNIKGNALFVNAYANYGGVEDADFVRQMSRDFAKAAFDANGLGELKDAPTPVPDAPPPQSAEQGVTSVDTDSFINVALGVTGVICVGILLFFLVPLFRGRKKDDAV